MKINKTINILALVVIAVFLVIAISMAQTQSGKAGGYVDSSQSVAGMTLWQMIKAGGSVMIPIGILSLIAMTITVYNFMTLHVHKLVPTKSCDELIEKLEKSEFDKARLLCTDLKENHNIIAKVVLSGLDKSVRTNDHVLIKEAMENRARMEITGLWQNLNYLADIAAITPLLGLLGTVLGMIQAFSVIVVQSAGVKPILLAAGISKAMITTAAGLIVAIPVLAFYSYFRGKLQQVTNAIETTSTDIIKIMEKS